MLANLVFQTVNVENHYSFTLAAIVQSYLSYMFHYTLITHQQDKL